MLWIVGKSNEDLGPEVTEQEARRIARRIVVIVAASLLAMVAIIAGFQLS